MKKPELTRRLARGTGLTRAEAADQLDRVVNEILSGLRRGKAVPLPGLGRFLPGQQWSFEPEGNNHGGSGQSR